MNGQSLSSVYAKISWAQEHAQLLDQELRAWIAEAPYTIAQKVNSDFTRHSVVISITSHPRLSVGR